MAKQNHEFIEALVELYDQIPTDEPQYAVRRAAVLVEYEIRRLVDNGQPVTTENLYNSFLRALNEHKKSA
jgi:hypothetical protein